MSTPGTDGTDFHALHELVAAARANLAEGPWGYLTGGGETETTVARNRAALDALAFRPRVLRDVATVDPSATVLGHRPGCPSSSPRSASSTTSTRGRRRRWPGPPPRSGCPRC